MPAPDHASAHRPRYLTDVLQIPQLTGPARDQLSTVARHYPFRVNEEYLKLINWDDPHDPIRRLVVPHTDELNSRWALDPCGEADYTVVPRLQHKYTQTAVLLCSDTCGGLCRYCFRKRLFVNGAAGAPADLGPALTYIAEHSEITNVLLTGGDSLALGTRRLRDIIMALRAIPHVRVIRLGSKMPAFDPGRLARDPELQEVLRTNSLPDRRIYLMAHFDHPRELTDAAIAGIDLFLRCGVICVNQCPLIKGINDDPKVLAELYQRLACIGCPPYYLFQCRPTAGNEAYVVPIVRGWEIFREAQRQGSGLSRRARFVMSHRTGKLEIQGVDERHIYLRYHRANKSVLRGQVLVFRRDDQACWLDELTPVDGAGMPRGASAPCHCEANGIRTERRPRATAKEVQA